MSSVERVKEILTLEKFREWLLKFPEEKTLRTIAVEANTDRCGCPLAVYLVSELTDLKVGVGNVGANVYCGEFNEGFVKFDEWAKAFVYNIDLASRGYDCWKEVTVTQMKQALVLAERGEKWNT